MDRYDADRVRALILALVLLPAVAHAYDFQIEAETVGQGYQLRAADDAVVNRRRLTQYLGLHLFNLGPTDEMGRPRPRNQFYITIGMRFDADFGEYPNIELPPGRTPEREVFPTRFDLLYAYLGGDSVFGFLDFKLGRQIMVDLFDYYAFDGLHVQARTPWHLAAEAWGGLNVSGLSIFDTPVYRVDGVALGGNPLGSLNARQEGELQPTFGVALRSYGYRDLSVRVSYMRTLRSR
jgi:hypothetical protein